MKGDMEKKPGFCAHVNSVMEEGNPVYKIVCRSCGTLWKGPGHMPKDIVIGWVEGGEMNEFASRSEETRYLHQYRALQEENKRLRETLEKVNMLCSHDRFCECLRDVWKIAEASLGGK